MLYEAVLMFCGFFSSSTSCVKNKQNTKRETNFSSIPASTLNRLTSAEMASSCVKLFHLFALAQFLYGLYYGHKYISPLDMKVRGFTFGGSFIYITILANVRSSKFIISSKIYFLFLSFFLSKYI